MTVTDRQTERTVPPTDRAAAISVEGLRKSFGGTEVVSGIDLTIEQGEFVTLLGPSGSGKSTILRCLAGLERPSAGRIRLGERTVADATVSVPPGDRNLAMIFQNYALWPHLTVLEHVLYPLKVRRTPRAERRGRALAALDSVGLAALAGRYPHALSGGQQQRVAVARALVARPDVLLMDEPLSNLDAQLRAQLRAELRTVHLASGATSVYVTHDQAEAFALSDRVLVLDHGNLVQAGSPLEIFRRPRTRFVAEFVGYQNVIDAAAVPAGDGELAELRAALDHALAEGRRQGRAGGTVAIRSNALLLEPPRGGALPLGSWTVVERTFDGAETAIVARRGTVELRATIPTTIGAQVAEAAALRPGVELHLWVDPLDAVVVEDRTS